MRKNLHNHYLVLGGTGSIGWAITEALLTRGDHVTIANRDITLTDEQNSFVEDLEDEFYDDNNEDEEMVQSGKEYYKDLDEDELPDIRTTPLDSAALDVTDAGETAEFPFRFLDDELAVIIYAVGSCPPGCFEQAIKTPLSQLENVRLMDDIHLHVVGLKNVLCQEKMFEALKPGAHVVVIGSAITRITDEQCPPWLYAGHYAVAKAAQAELIKWLRRDPRVKEKGILIHHICPSAVDTPFHQDCERRPPVLLPLSAVTQKVMEALASPIALDVMVLPEPS